MKDRIWTEPMATNSWPEEQLEYWYVLSINNSICWMTLMNGIGEWIMLVKMFFTSSWMKFDRVWCQYKHNVLESWWA